MATRKIVVLGNETLRKVSKPVVAFDDALGILLDDMKTTMLEKKGVGISAVQVGVLRRAIVIELEPKKYLESIQKSLKQRAKFVTQKAV